MKSAIAIGHQRWLSLFYVVISAVRGLCARLYGYLPHYSDHCFTIQRTHAYKSDFSLSLFFCSFAAHIVALDLLDRIGLLASIVLYCAFVSNIVAAAVVWRTHWTATKTATTRHVYEKNNLFRLVCRYYFSTLIITLLPAYKNHLKIYV